jgi:transposase
MPIMTAVRVNPWLRAYYERLVSNGKPWKVALVAAMRKLLAAVWSVSTSRRACCSEVGENLRSCA